jgi:hypothetical protein
VTYIGAVISADIAHDQAFELPPDTWQSIQIDLAIYPDFTLYQMKIEPHSDPIYQRDPTY